MTEHRRRRPPVQPRSARRLACWRTVMEKRTSKAKRMRLLSTLAVHRSRSARHRELCCSPAGSAAPGLRRKWAAPRAALAALADGTSAPRRSGGNGAIPSRRRGGFPPWPAIGLADGRVHDGQGRVAGSGPSGPCPGQQLWLTGEFDGHAPRAKADGPQGGWRLVAARTLRTGAQRIGVVDQSRSQGGGDQRQILSPVFARSGAPEVKVMVDEFPQAQVQWARVAERSSPAFATRRWSSGWTGRDCSVRSI